MTISNTVRSAGPYTGNNVTTVFPFGFKVFLTSEIEVVRSDGTTQTTLVQDSDYTVSLNLDQDSTPGGSITTIGAPLSPSYTLTVTSNVAELQGASLQNQGGFYPKVIEAALDRAVILIQQLRSIANRTLRFPISDTGTNTELPTKNARANNLLGFDANGNPVAVVPASQSATALALALASSAGASMVGIDGQTIADFFKNKVNRVVDSVVELRTVDKTKYTKVLMTGYTAGSRAGTGMFTFDPADTTTADNGGTVIVGADGGRWKLVHNGEIHISQWGDNLANAIDFMPVGGHLRLGAGPYVAKFSKTRSDLKITGLGMPLPNGGNTALTGGSIIQGTLGLTGDRLHLADFGVDCGSAVCTAINGGAAMDCFAILDPTRTIRKRFVFHNLAGLCKDAASAAHNFLFEGLDDCDIRNVVSRFGQWGCVMKTTNSNANGITSYNCSQAGFTFKSDSGVAGTPALRSNVSNVFIDNSGLPTAVQGIFIYAATSSIADFTLSNAQTRGGDIGVKLVCDTRAVNVNLLRDVVLNNIIIEDAVTFGFDTFGAISGVQVSNMDIRNTTSNKSLRVQADCLGIQFTNVNCSAPVVNALNVDLGGRFSFDGLRSFVNGDYNSPSGINIAPDAASTFKVGKYLGTMGLNGVQGWTPAWTGLTVVNGTGGVTHTGSYRFDGAFIEGEAQIAVTGTATTQSTATATFINNLPFQPLRNDTCTVISGTVSNGGVGLVQVGGQNCFTPSWAAYNGTMVVKFRYRFQA